MKNAMLLSDHDIAREIQHGRLAVAPYNPGNLQPASLDVTLDSRFLRFHSQQRPPEAGIDPTQPDPVCWNTRTSATKGCSYSVPTNLRWGPPLSA